MQSEFSFYVDTNKNYSILSTLDTLIYQLSISQQKINKISMFLLGIIYSVNQKLNKLISCIYNNNYGIENWKLIESIKQRLESSKISSFIFIRPRFEPRQRLG